VLLSGRSPTLYFHWCHQSTKFDDAFSRALSHLIIKGLQGGQIAHHKRSRIIKGLQGGQIAHHKRDRTK